ncbi:unnamed protein product [Acanthoscelides obtectus]|uniref:Uncharacterized protein n=1 Tax=Acanthoscelides obtectus TaxID=200917 RepID=A0A9P0NTU8_ACAOB|nr:unnamed protein product [Acanthoscelides obtectus]CAK1634827.1 hypothetical protein AOBTE_LOCUS8913 [Acanthoscelides obtectus]
MGESEGETRNYHEIKGIDDTSCSRRKGQRQTLIIESHSQQIKELTETMKSKELMTPAVADEKDRTIQRQTLIIESQAQQIKELTETVRDQNSKIDCLTTQVTQ